MVMWPCRELENPFLIQVARLYAVTLRAFDSIQRVKPTSDFGELWQLSPLSKVSSSFIKPAAMHWIHANDRSPTHSLRAATRWSRCSKEPTWREPNGSSTREKEVRPLAPHPTQEERPHEAARVLT
jgi:hypothetical protein